MRALALVFATALVVTAVGDAARGDRTPGSRLATSCAPFVDFAGARYVGSGVEVAPTEGPVVGTGTFPACDDIPAEPVTVAAIQAVPPELAIMLPGELGRVFVRQPPRALTRLFDAPRCAPRTVPFVLKGPWLGILGADGHTEVDLVPPYDLELFVASTTAPRYARAFLTVRVPRSLGRPLTRAAATLRRA